MAIKRFVHAFGIVKRLKTCGVALVYKILIVLPKLRGKRDIPFFFMRSFIFLFFFLFTYYI